MNNFNYNIKGKPFWFKHPPPKRDSRATLLHQRAITQPYRTIRTAKVVSFWKYWFVFIKPILKYKNLENYNAKRTYTKTDQNAPPFPGA